MKFNTDHWDKWLDQSFIDDGITLVPYDVLINYLRNGHKLRAMGGIRMLQCMMRPSFFPWISYEIFDEQERYYLLKTECKLTDPRPIKMRVKRKMGVLPVFTYSHQEIDEHIVIQWLEKFRLPVPVFAEGPIGGDGTIYEICVESGFQSARYVWWDFVSQEWEELDKRFKDVIHQIETIVKET